MHACVSIYIIWRNWKKCNYIWSPRFSLVSFLASCEDVKVLIRRQHISQLFLICDCSCLIKYMYLLHRASLGQIVDMYVCITIKCISIVWSPHESKQCSCWFFRVFVYIKGMQSWEGEDISIFLKSVGFFPLWIKSKDLHALCWSG